MRILRRLSFCVTHILINHLRIMNKADLINAIAAESGLSKADSKKALDAFVSSVTGALKGGDKRELKEPVLTLLQNKLSLFRQRRLLSLKQVQNSLRLLNKLYS